MNKNTKKIAALVAATGATAALACIGAGSATAVPGGVADGCYQVISPISALPGSGLGTKIGTAHVKGRSINILGQRGTITSTPTGGWVRIVGLDARLTAKSIGPDGDRMTVYRVTGVPGVGILSPTC